MTPRLVRQQRRGERTRWDESARALLDGAHGFVRVRGGPGTGKTTLLAELAAARILAGDGEQVLVLAPDRRAANAMRIRISALLADEGVRTRREPLVRTVHSYAFGVLRRHAAMHEQPSPRLLPGPEQDAMVRVLLAGDIEDDADYWPASLRPAIGLPGFASEVRDLLLRASERGLGPEHLIKLGRAHKRPEWVAAGKFGRTYEQVTLLQGTVGAQHPQATAPALDAAELVAAALLAFDTDEVLLSAERARIRHLLVDDAQHLDPQAFAFAKLLGETGAEFVLAGDADQSVFSFRGADAGLFTGAEPDYEVRLGEQHRMAKPIASAVGRVCSRLPGTRLPVPEGERAEGSIEVRLLPSQAAEANWIAGRLRRAHLMEGVPWARMAIVTRSVPRSLAALRRALLAAGVPVSIPAREIPLPTHEAVRGFLTLLRCAADLRELDAETAAALLSSQLGGADALAMRRVRRGLRRLELAGGGDRPSGEVLAEVLRDDDPLTALEPDAAAPVRRVADLLHTAVDALDEGVERMLWRVWERSGLQRRWTEAAARGGHLGRMADRDLDAMVALFDAAASYVDRLPGASPAGFVEYLAGQQIAGDSLAPTAPDSESVTVTSAHAACGREWDLVAVAGVAEGSWPDLRTRGTLLGVERLVDTLSGIQTDTTSTTSELLAEERRLFVVAASRARNTLLVSAVRGEEEQPSRFLDELVTEQEDPVPEPQQASKPERGLVLAELIGELRKALADPGTPADRRARAARQLARLARAGVPGAHPDTWYALAEPSSTAPLWGPEETVDLSPSTVDVLTTCPLRWLVQRVGGTDPAELPATTGSLIHALAQAAAEGASTEEVDAELDKAWSQLDIAAPWFSRREQDRLRGMLRAFETWLKGSRAELTQRALEAPLSVQLEDSRVRLRGRVDRLEVDGEGRPVIVDIKTSKTAVSAEQAAEHAQLAVYQLAAALGAFEGVSRQPGGARLLYVAAPKKRTGVTERGQDAPDAERLADWARMVIEAAETAAGPGYLAVANDQCPTCPARISCPAHEDGRQVTG
ncbi:ATP-dependent helicase [Sciscionella marina]|uniref:ATP-dependent helicase n=1 Tax=Sciscionella marina TaxID=508770 RepID=UPI0003A2C854|nr:ATP-dependent DNA helicase [Sciscionella marina]